MNITIFGATGKTGIILLEKALLQGQHVTVYARNPSKISQNQEKLKLIKGELTDLSKIEEAVQDADAVISLLGPLPGSKDLLVSVGMKNIIEAMGKKGIKRLIATATPSFKVPQDTFQFEFTFAVFVVKNLFRYSYENIVRIGNQIWESDLDWSMVRLPMLSDASRKGNIKIGYPGEDIVNLFFVNKSRFG
jgi:hypothetical protein